MEESLPGRAYDSGQSRTDEPRGDFPGGTWEPSDAPLTIRILLPESAEDIETARCVVLRPRVSPDQEEYAWAPTPEEIRAACLEIQAGWSERERQSRSRRAL